MRRPQLLEHPTRQLFFTGKGGVGKTTVDGSLPGLKADRIDPKAETEKYIAKVMAAEWTGLDAEGIALHRRGGGIPRVLAHLQWEYRNFGRWIRYQKSSCLCSERKGQGPIPLNVRPTPSPPSFNRPS